MLRDLNAEIAEIQKQLESVQRRMTTNSSKLFCANVRGSFNFHNPTWSGVITQLTKSLNEIADNMDLYTSDVQTDLKTLRSVLASFKADLQSELLEIDTLKKDIPFGKKLRVKDDIDEIRHHMKKVKKHQRKIAELLDDLEVKLGWD